MSRPTPYAFDLYARVKVADEIWEAIPKWKQGQ